MLGELSWGATVSAFQGLVAKEQVVSSMAIIAGLAGDVSEGSMIFGAGDRLRSSLRAALWPLSCLICFPLHVSLPSVQ